MNTPKWAQELTIEAMLYLEAKGYRSDLPIIEWRHPKARVWDFNEEKSHKIARECSSGITYKHHITICGGSNRIDCKMVLLHELAHWVNPDDHHSQAFWDTAWDLYRHFKLPIRYCVNREKTYRKCAIVSYRKNRKG